MKKNIGGDYIRLDDNVSYQLYETNPKLSTNIKLMYDNSNMFLETYDVDNIDDTKKTRIYPNGLYNKDLIKFWNDFGKIDKNIVSSSYKCKLEKIPYKFGYNYGYVAPLYLKEKLPEHFVIFRLDGDNEKIERVYDNVPENIQSNNLIFENLITKFPDNIKHEINKKLDEYKLSIDNLKKGIGIDDNLKYNEIVKRFTKYKQSSQLKVSEQFKNDIKLFQRISKWKKRIEEKRSVLLNIFRDSVSNIEGWIDDFIECWLCGLVMYKKVLNKQLDIQSPLTQYAYYCYKYGLTNFVERISYYNDVLSHLYDWKFRKYGDKLQMVKTIESIYRFYVKTKYNDIEDYYITLNGNGDVELVNDKTTILQKSSIVKIFDLRDKSTLGTYLKNYITQSGFKFDKTIKISNNDNNPIVELYGIDNFGNFTTKKFKNKSSVNYYNDNFIFPYIINIEYMFNDNDEKSSGKYYGLYCNTIDLYELEYSNPNDVKNTDFKLQKRKGFKSLYEIPSDKLYDDDKKCRQVINVRKVGNKKNVYYSDGKSFFYIKDKHDNIYKLKHHQDMIYGQMYYENLQNFDRVNKYVNRYLKDYYGFDKILYNNLITNNNLLINYVDPSDVFDWTNIDNLLGYENKSVTVDCKKCDVGSYPSSLGFFVEKNPYNGTSIDIKITNKHLDENISIIENTFVIDHVKFKISTNKDYLIYGEDKRIDITDKKFTYNEFTYKFNDDYSEIVSLYKANEIQLTARDEIITHIHDLYFEHVYPENGKHGDGCEHIDDDFHDTWDIDDIMKGEGRFPKEDVMNYFGNKDDSSKSDDSGKDIFDDDIITFGGECPFVGIGIIYKTGITTYPISFLRYDVTIDKDNYSIKCKESTEIERINKTTVFKEEIIYNQLLKKEEQDLTEYVRFYDKQDGIINEVRIYAPKILYRNKKVYKSTIENGEVILHLKSNCPLMGIGLVYKKNNRNLPISYRKYNIEWVKEKDILRFKEISDSRINELTFDVQKTIDKLIGESEPQKYVKLYSDISDVYDDCVIEFRIYDPDMYLTSINGSDNPIKIFENGEINMRIIGDCPYVGLGIYRKNDKIEKYIKYIVKPRFDSERLELRYDSHCGETISDGNRKNGEFTINGKYDNFYDVELMKEFILNQGVYGKNYKNFNNYIRTYTKDDGYDIEIRLYVPDIYVWQDKISEDDDKGAYDTADLTNYKYILRCDNYKNMFITTTMKPGTYHITRNKRIYYSCNGTKNDVAVAITNAINSYPYYSREIEACRNKNLVVLKYAIKGSKYNGENNGVKIDVTFDGTYIYKNIINIPTDRYNRHNYTYTFTGGSNNSDNLFLVSNDKIDLLTNNKGKERFIRTSNGEYSRIKSINPYVDNEDLPHTKTSIVSTDKYGKYISVGFNRIQLYERYFPKIGVLSFFPIKKLKDDLVYINQSSQTIKSTPFLMVSKYDKNVYGENIEIKYRDDFYIPFGTTHDYEDINFNSYVRKWKYLFENCDDELFNKIFVDMNSTCPLRYETINGTSISFRNVKFNFKEDFIGYKFTFVFIPYFNKKDIFIDEPYYIKNDMCKAIFGIMFINVFDDTFSLDYLNNVSNIIDEKFKNENFINNLTFRKSIKNISEKDEDVTINSVQIDKVNLFKIGLFDIDNLKIDWNKGIKVTSVVFDKVLKNILTNGNIDVQVKVYNGESFNKFKENQYVLENVKTINDLSYINGVLKFKNQLPTTIYKGYELKVGISFLFKNIKLNMSIINDDNVKQYLKEKVNMYKFNNFKNNSNDIVISVETLYSDYKEIDTEDMIKFTDLITLNKSFPSSNVHYDE